MRNATSYGGCGRLDSRTGGWDRSAFFGAGSAAFSICKLRSVAGPLRIVAGPSFSCIRPELRESFLEIAKAALKEPAYLPGPNRVSFGVRDDGRAGRIPNPRPAGGLG
jgi:hypothetical protein